MLHPRISLENGIGHELLMADLDRIFATPGIPEAQISRDGLQWALRAGTVEETGTYLDGSEIACWRSKVAGNNLSAASRIEVIHRAEQNKRREYSYGETAYQDALIPPNAGRWIPIKEATHYSVMSILLHHVIEFQPGRVSSKADVLRIPPLIQYGVFDQAI